MPFFLLCYTSVSSVLGTFLHILQSEKWNTVPLCVCASGICRQELETRGKIDSIDVRVPFNVDIGVGDVIVPCAEERVINTQFPDFEAPIIKTYSLESTIAEKFDTILQRFELTLQWSEIADSNF